MGVSVSAGFSIVITTFFFLFGTDTHHVQNSAERQARPLPSGQRLACRSARGSQSTILLFLSSCLLDQFGFDGNRNLIAYHDAAAFGQGIPNQPKLFSVDFLGSRNACP